MPYNGTGTINISLGEQSERDKKNISQTGCKLKSSSRLDGKDDPKYIGVNIQKQF